MDDWRLAIPMHSHKFPPCSMYGRHKRGRRDDCNRTESYSVAIFNHTSGSPFTCLIRGNGGIIGIAGGFSWVPALLPAASDRPCTVCHLHFCTGARQRISAVQVAQLLSESIPGRRCLIPSAIFALFSSPPCTDIVTKAPELPITIFELQLPERLRYHQAALSFQIPHTCATLYLGGES